MRSRWFHKPALHAPEHGEGKKVSWLELFYDLIFVAAIIQLGDYLSADVTPRGFALFAGHFAPLWIAWTGFTFYANRFNVDDFTHRALVLAQMFAVGTMAIASHEAMAGEPAVFSLAFAVAQGILAALHWRSWRHEPSSRDYTRYWGLVFAVGAVSFGLAALLPSPACYLLWAVGLGGVLISPISHQSRALTERFPLDQEHLSERYGLLTIIVLGESFVKVLSELTQGEHSGAGEILQGFFNLTLTCCIWWIYFDDVGGSRIRRHRGAWVIWLYGHLPLTLAITAVGVAVKKALGFDLHEIATPAYRWLLAGSLALTFASVAVIDSVTERRNAELSDKNRVNARAASAFLMLLLGQVGASTSAGVFLGVVAGLCVAQVLFDMMMAPFEESEEMHRAVSTAELARRRQEAAESAAPARMRRDVREAVRKGAPAELRQDMYFFFMEGSWTRLLVSFTVAFLLLNLTFAAVFMLDPSSIGGDRAGTFGAAFAFSVQTFATIGYGALSPVNAFGDLIVTIEAIVGVLFVALATGLTFAKASRARSGVLFSRYVVITTRNGQQTLMFRAANARGNDVVEASMSVSVLVDEISPEGHHMRRVYDLPLLRSRQPMFVLSWTIMHVIDETSPLRAVDWSNPGEHIMGLVVTLMGHDATYGQTTHARHLYYPEQFKLNHRMVDVISELPDGRLMIDLSLFHLVEPEGEASAPATASP